jgi:AcrR family transcriptional regulator
MAASRTAPADKRRVILDAAMRVFARQGFHTCRVSDIADEAGVAYGLVYHYFSSKDEILDTMFLERWNVMLGAIAEADRSERSPRDKLRAIAGFIVDSYRYEPELMKVIVVEVTRAANTFGRTHLEKIREAYAQIAGIVERAQAAGIFRSEISPEFGALAFYGSIEQVLTRWIFDRGPVDDDELEDAKTMIVETICRGLERDPAAPRGPGSTAAPIAVASEASGGRRPDL